MFVSQADTQLNARWIRTLNGNQGSGGGGYGGGVGMLIPGNTFLVSPKSNVYTNFSVSNCSPIIGGLTNNTPFTGELFLRYNSAGDPQWMKRFFSFISRPIVQASVACSNDNLIFAGVYNSYLKLEDDTLVIDPEELSRRDHFYMLSLDSNWNPLNFYTSPSNIDARCLGKDADGNIYLSGRVADYVLSFGQQQFYYNNNGGLFIAKMTKVPMGSDNVSRGANNISLSPNPAAGSCKIAFKQGTVAVVQILDGTGREVQRVPVGKWQSSIAIQTNQLANGLYFVRCTGKAPTTSTSLVVNH